MLQHSALCLKEIREKLTSLYMFCSLSFSSGFMTLDTFSRESRQTSVFSPSVTILHNSTYDEIHSNALRGHTVV